MIGSQRPIRVLAAFDSFKDSLSADIVGDVCLKTLEKLYGPKVETKLISLSDGGEGFTNSLAKPLGISLKTTTATGPLGDPIKVFYGIRDQVNGVDSEKIAVIEMAEPSGLEKVPLDKRSPMNTTTRGTGELVLEAVRNGCKKIILGIGGTATSDGGLGALHAMGMKVKVRNEGGVISEPEVIYGRHLACLEDIEIPHPLLPPGVSIEIACDVISPFVGPRGAVYTFSGQKGATEDDKKKLEAGMIKFASLLKERTGVDISNMKGAGAGGGLPGSFVAVLDAKLKRGIELVTEAHHLKESIKNSDLVLTGEGCYDSTTKTGKVVWEVQKYGEEYNVPVVVICGRKKDADDEKVKIFDLISFFDEESCFKKTRECLSSLIERNSIRFPVLCMISKL